MKKTIHLRQTLLFLGDIILYYSALIITIILNFQKQEIPSALSQHILPFTFILPVWLLIFFLFGFYQLEKLKTRYLIIKQTLVAFLVAGILSVVFFYLTPFFGIAPKTNLLIFGTIFLLFVLLWRFFLAQIWKSYFKKNILVVGAGEEIENFIKTLKSSPQFGYSIVATLKSWDAETVKNLISKNKIHIIVLDKRNFSLGSQRMLYFLLSRGIDIWDFYFAYESIFQKIPINHIDYGWFMNNLKEGEKLFVDKIKRLIDILLAIIFIIISLPLSLLISLSIKLEDRGPIFYKQKRVGKNLKEFYIYKFRSMIPDAEKSVVVWAQENDPRITKVGRFLRKTHLDELPQMINILKGDISFVGPRPERPEFVKELEKKIPFYNLRHIIKPGFTGWAQIKFRYARSIEDTFQKLEYDLYYIKNRSLILDLYILIKTINLLFRE
ncbi:exopolysaccharide biosynthesis polyprenyl glycosylphosphotransferase [bacterium]|nr:exopolysaccharide biosynthesis polyprenyl glycosylphosphotransferase [bacterium]